MITDPLTTIQWSQHTFSKKFALWILALSMTCLLFQQVWALSAARWDTVFSWREEARDNGRTSVPHAVSSSVRALCYTSGSWHRSQLCCSHSPLLHPRVQTFTTSPPSTSTSGLSKNTCPVGRHPSVPKSELDPLLFYLSSRHEDNCPRFDTNHI